MARLVGFAEGSVIKTSFSLARSIAGVIAADNASLVDANFPITQGIDCSLCDTILVAAEITGGTSPSATIEALLRDDDAPDGFRWKRPILGSPPGVTAAAAAGQTTSALGPNDVFELRVFGCPLVLLRVTAVANPATTTKLDILVRPGAMRLPPRRR